MTNQFDLNAYLTSLNLNVAKAAPKKNKVYTIDNTATRDFLNELDAMNYNEVPAWVDDVISGACGQIPGTQRFSPARLFNMLRALDVITTERVGTYLNRRCEALGEEMVSERYVRYVTQAVRCGSQAIAHHKHFQKSVEVAPVIKEFKPLPYSEEEMKKIKFLSLNATFAELCAYEAELKIKYAIA